MGHRLPEIVHAQRAPAAPASNAAAAVATARGAAAAACFLAAESESSGAQLPRGPGPLGVFARVFFNPCAAFHSCVARCSAVRRVLGEDDRAGVSAEAARGRGGDGGDGPRRSEGEGGGEAAAHAVFSSSKKET